MTTLKSQRFLEFLIKFMKPTKLDSKSVVVRKLIVTNKSAWWKCLKRLTACYKSWLLLIMIFRVPQICAYNSSSTESVTSITYQATMLVPTVSIVNSVREKLMTVSEKDKIIMGLSKSGSNDEYDDDDDNSEEEVYDYSERLNYSGESVGPVSKIYIFFFLV